MKVSKFNFFITKSEKKYVYNSRSGAFAEIDDRFSEYHKLVETDSNFKADDELFNEMVKSKILIENETDEFAELKQVFEEDKQRDSHSIFTIAPTLNCNFNCPYCYEDKNTIVMSDEHVSLLIEFIKKSIMDKKSIHITWYGGEPLLAKNKIYEISEAVIPFCEENNIAYTSMIVTNGYLLNDEIIEQLKKHKVSIAQVTLDGDREHHNKKRFLKTGAGSYDKIIENIKKLGDAGINVSIRVNVDANNEDSLGGLMDDLKKQDFKNTSIYFGLLAAITEVCSSIASSCITNESFSLKTLRWNNMLMEKGLTKSLLNFYPSILKSPCAALSENSFVIDSKGDFYKCWDDIGKEEMRVAHLGELDKMPFPKNSNLQRYTEWSPFNYKKCSECKTLPLCSGFCAFLAIKGGEPQCSKWKYTIEDYLNALIDDKEVIVQHQNNQ